MKKLARLLLVLALLLVLLGGGVLLFVDSLARQAVERGGTYALGVETRLESANIGLFSGRFALEGLHVANPAGFQAPNFFEMRSARLELPLSSLTAERIEIPILELSGIALDLERNATGTNYAAILASLARFQEAKGGSESQGTEDGQGSGKVFRLGELHLAGIRATVQLLPTGGDLTRMELAIPEVRVQGLASDLTLPQLCALVVRTVIDAAIRQGGDTLPRELLDDLRGRVDQLEASARAQLESEVGELQLGLNEALLGEAKKLGPEAEAAAKQATDALGSKLGGLLDHGKKKKE